MIVQHTIQIIQDVMRIEKKQVLEHVFHRCIFIIHMYYNNEYKYSYNSNTMTKTRIKEPSNTMKIHGLIILLLNQFFECLHAYDFESIDGSFLITRGIANWNNKVYLFGGDGGNSNWLGFATIIEVYDKNIRTESTNVFFSWGRAGLTAIPYEHGVN